MRAGEYERLLAGQGLAEDAVLRLGRYLELLGAWSTRVNLTGFAEGTERVDRLVGDVLGAARQVAPGTALDVGSGNGSPGVVVAVVRQDVRVTLLEPRLRRWAFLREAVRAVGRAGIDVRRERLEDYSGPRQDTLLLRGLRVDEGSLRRVLTRGGDVVTWAGDWDLTRHGFALQGEPGGGARAWKDVPRETR